jgi:hypothetical protein
MNEADGAAAREQRPAAGNPFRVLILVLAALASVYAWAVFATTFTHPGSIGIDYNAPGSDWMVFHGAARAYIDGQLAMIFDGHRFTGYLNQSYGWWLSEPLPFRPWVYPPSYLLLIMPFGGLGLVTSYALFQAVTAAALVAAIMIGSKVAPSRLIAACAVLCPAAAITVVDGQNSFLIAALLVAGVRLLKERPLLAGLVLGILSVKPQFALLVPVALIAGRHWSALGVAAVSALALAAASAMVFGLDSWGIWLQQTLASLTSPDPEWISYGRIWGNSVWTCATLLGASPALASALQLAAFGLSILAVGIAFRKTGDASVRLAVLLTATILAAPHWSAYDAVLLTLAASFWLLPRYGEGVENRTWILMLLVWVLPLLSPPALVPVARILVPGLMLTLLWLACGAVRPSPAVRT